MARLLLIPLCFPGVAACGRAGQPYAPLTPTTTVKGTHKLLSQVPVAVDGVRYEPAEYVRKFEGVEVYIVYNWPSWSRTA